MAEENSKLTSDQQIDRLLRPGAQYRNLNPYEVLDVDPEEDDDVLKKKIRTVSSGWVLSLLCVLANDVCSLLFFLRSAGISPASRQKP